MLDKILTVLTQEPPVPTPGEPPGMLPSPVIYVAVAIVIAGIIAWRYKAVLEFIAIFCSTIGGFIIGLVATPPYANIGLGMMIAIAGLMISSALVALLRLIRKTKQTTTISR